MKNASAEPKPPLWPLPRAAFATLTVDRREVAIEDGLRLGNKGRRGDPHRSAELGVASACLTISFVSR